MIFYGHKFCPAKGIFDFKKRSGYTVGKASGRIVTEDTKLIQKTQSDLANEYIRNFFHTMKELGYSAEEIVSLVKEMAEKE